MYSQTLNNMLTSLNEKKGALSKALLIPFILLSLIEYFMSHFAQDLTILFVLIICSLLINVVVAIAVHRILLLGEHAVPAWGLFQLTKREQNFLIKSILLALLMIPAILLALIPYIGFLLSIPYFFIVFSRLSLVFPSIAADEPLSFKEAWQMSQNHTLYVVTLVLIIPLLTALLLNLIYGMAIGFIINVVSSNLVFLYSILNLFITVLLISALSETYKMIKAQKAKHNVESTNHSQIEETLGLSKQEENLNSPVSIQHSEHGLIITISSIETLSFTSLKQQLQEQYEKLGFSETIIDEEQNFVIKNPNKKECYVSLLSKDQSFVIETFNTQEPKLEILQKQS